MRSATTVIIGAGQSGLAMSRHLADRSIDHVILERGEVANSWRTERWDSLRLLTPNWQSRLPGYAYDGDDPDGFMTMPEVVHFLQRYAEPARAPVVTGTCVMRVRQVEGGYEVATSQGPWVCRTLVIASGACNIAAVPWSARRGDEAHASAILEPWSSPRWWRVDRRRLGERHSACPGDPSFWSPCCAFRRRARADAAYLPRTRHPTVDGRCRRHECSLQRRRGH